MSSHRRPSRIVGLICRWKPMFVKTYHLDAIADRWVALGDPGLWAQSGMYCSHPWSTLSVNIRFFCGEVMWKSDGFRSNMVQGASGLLICKVRDGWESSFGSHVTLSDIRWLFHYVSYFNTLWRDSYLMTSKGVVKLYRVSGKIIFIT